MKTEVLIVLVLVGYAASLMPAGVPTPPWLDTSLCPPTDSLTLCQLKKSQCAPLDQLLTPPGGIVGALTTCATASGVTLSSTFFMSVGPAFMRGTPEAVLDQASPDPATTTTLRRCVLNSTGLLDPVTLTLNRTTIAAQIRGALTSPGFGEAVATSVGSCPEPVGFDMKPFMACMKASCMNEAANSPLVAIAQAFLPDLTPTAKMAAKKATKKPFATPVASPFIIP